MNTNVANYENALACVEAVEYELRRQQDELKERYDELDDYINRLITIETSLEELITETNFDIRTAKEKAEQEQERNDKLEKGILTLRNSHKYNKLVEQLQ